MSVDYWLGVATLPVLAALGYGGMFGYLWVEMMAERKLGVTWEARLERNIESVSNYILNHDIWFERSFGPVFTGHWYREIHGARVNRWFGIGSVNGPYVILFRKTRLSDE